jgi:hypothetical protein
MDSPASSRRNWKFGVPQTCKTCGELKDYEDFHQSGKGPFGARKTECKPCRNKKAAKYAQDRVWANGPCYFCDSAGIYRGYCQDHWQQYRPTYLEEMPDLRMMVKYMGYVAQYFNVSTNMLLYGDSKKHPAVHMRMVALHLIKHLTNAPLDRLGLLVSRDRANVCRMLQKANKFYIMYPEFAEDVDGILDLMRKDGIIQ